MGADRARHVVLNYRPVAGKLLKGAKRAKSGSKDVSPIANVSALAPVDDDLWTAPDEGAAIERLTRDTIGYGRRAQLGSRPAVSGVRRRVREGEKSRQGSEEEKPGGGSRRPCL